MKSIAIGAASGALAIVLYGGVALAQRPADVGADIDGDGLVSRQEFEQRAAERFTRLDRDRDGFLSREELRGARAGAPRGPGGPPGVALAAADTDGDGALSLAEIQAVRPEFSAERFAEVDKNHDGLITADERPRRPRHE